MPYGTGMRIAFMGSPDFSVPTLRALVAAGHDVVAVYAQPPKPAGRGQALTPCPVHAAADALGLAVRTPKSLKDETEQAAFAALNLDLAVVVAYGKILPLPILNAPRMGCINGHGSLLPRWRGAAPIHRAIMAGDAETGIDIMQMKEGLDTGPTLLRATTPITVHDTTGTLHDRLSTLAAPLMVQAVAGLAAGTLTPQIQPETGATYAAKIDKSEARIDWSRDAGGVDRHIRGLSPFPGAWFEHDGTRVKVLMSAQAEGAGTPGTVLDDQLTIACGSGAVRLITLQRAGKGAMDAATFQNGFALSKGAVLA